MGSCEEVKEKISILILSSAMSLNISEILEYVWDPFNFGVFHTS